MKYKKITDCVSAMFLSALLGAPVLANSKGDQERDQDNKGARDSRVVNAELIGYQEVPSVSSTCEGQFHATISDDNTQIEFALSYEKLEGNVQQAHIHFGQKSVNGGVSIFLCSNLGNAPAGTPSCPGPNSGTVTGTRQAASVIGGAAAQGIAAGELEELIEAIQAGKAYANVHSDKFPTGECRGQIR